MQVKLPRRAGGRPKRKLKPGERVPLSLRVTPEAKRLIDAASERSGRSQSAEVEFRLEASFKSEKLLSQVLELAYGSEFASLLLTLAETMRTAGVYAASVSFHAEAEADKLDAKNILEALDRLGHWPRDAFAFSQVMKAAQFLFEALKPDGDDTPPPKPRMLNAPPEFASLNSNALIGEGAARAILVDVIRQDGTTEAMERGQQLRETLGPKLVERIRSRAAKLGLLEQ
jgi:hypothetical protein